MKCGVMAALTIFAGVAFGAAPEMVKIGGAGKVAVVNTCDAPTDALDVALRKVTNLLMINYEIKKGEWKMAEAQKCFEATKASAAQGYAIDAGDVTIGGAHGTGSPLQFLVADTMTGPVGGAGWTAVSTGPGPVPEPTSGLLLLLGVAGLALKRKRA